MEQAFATYAGVIAVLRVALFWLAVVVALIATLVPMRRALHIDPMDALRVD